MAQGHIADLVSLISDVMDFFRSAHEAIVERRQRRQAAKEKELSDAGPARLESTASRSPERDQD